jgi:hypothetical protein
VTKTFGEEVEKVLFVFDGTQAPDMNSLIAKVGTGQHKGGHVRAAALLAASVQSSLLCSWQAVHKSALCVPADHRGG